MTLSIGLGCRRGVSAAGIAAAVRAAARCLLRAYPTWADRPVCQLATIDAKRDEPGLLAYCNRYALPIRFASASALAEQAPGPMSPGSEAVLARFGIPGVCEAAALWAASGADTGTPTPALHAELVLRKMAFDGVTVAFATTVVVPAKAVSTAARTVGPASTTAAPASEDGPEHSTTQADALASPSSHFTISLYELAHDDEDRS